jgi:hypothetical protein
MNNFSITSQLKQKEYLKLNYLLLYSKAWIICLCAFAALFVLVSVVMYFTHNYAIFDSDWYYYGVMFAVWGILIPVIPCATVLLTFKSNKLIQEVINYEFTEVGVNIAGESFTSTYQWRTFYKVKGINGWLLLYQSNRSAHVIKLGTDGAEQIKTLKDFLKASGLKIKMEL